MHSIPFFFGKFFTGLSDRSILDKTKQRESCCIRLESETRIKERPAGHHTQPSPQFLYRLLRSIFSLNILIRVAII